MSLESRTIDGVTTPGVAGNPKSQAKDRPSVPATAAPGEPRPGPDFGGEAGDIGEAG
jgi:hypothetical protein